MTHTLETTGISRGVARALRLNEDLVEAIGLGHDLGHTPFGHAGEEALDEALRERFDRRFHHNEHSLRIVDVLERDGRGLNLTAEVRDGILNHTGPERAGHARGQDRPPRRPRRLHQPRHRRRRPRRRARPGRAAARRDRAARPDRARGAIDALVHDLVETSAREGDIRQSEEVGAAMLALRIVHVRARLPRRGRRAPSTSRARATVQRIFDHLLERGDSVDDVIDYVAGMTDRFALSYAETL